ncbi:MAG TPA: secretin N-terminal domain-containing protein [Acidobacteriota bacterium]|nr:secretin N-terminal domain-containing protein [Acidobacteriota bacterium]
MIGPVCSSFCRGTEEQRSGGEEPGILGTGEQGRKVGEEDSFQLRNHILSSAPLLLCTSAFIFAFYLLANAQDTLLTKAFAIKFKKVDQVASLINGLLSEKGAVTLQPRLQTIVVQDYEKNLRQIEMAIAAFDVPPPAAEVSVKLVRASKNEEASPISDEIKNMARVGDVLKFNQYALLDSGIVECEEGQNSVLALAREYQISFVPDIIQEGNNIIRLKNFQLKKKKKDGNGKDSYLPLLTVTVNLRNAETLVLGASRFEESDQALLIMLLGKVKK